MSSRWYPIFQKGNPQLRVFLPDFWLKLVQPQFNQPPNIVQFITSLQMTDHDIKNYLEKIYSVPVAHVRSEIVEGELKRARGKGYVIKEDDYRRAFVTLNEGETFEFPDIGRQKKVDDESEMKTYRKQTERSFKEYAKKNQNRPGVPGWFGV